MSEVNNKETSFRKEKKFGDAVQVRLDPALKAKIKRYAQLDGRIASDFIRKILQAYVDWVEAGGK